MKSSQEISKELTLEIFNYLDFFEKEFGTHLIDNPPQVQLTQMGINLVEEYYSYKYQMRGLIKKMSMNVLINNIKEIHSNTGNSQDEIRIPLLITGDHSTAVVYIVKEKKASLVILDSLGDQSMADIAAVAFPRMNVYTGINKCRQHDHCSCHTEALVYLRELTGKNQNGHFVIPDLITKLEINKIKNSSLADSSLPPNVYVIKLFDSLLMTIQHPYFKKLHEDEYKSKEIIHHHHDKPETITNFSNRYPPEKSKYFGKDPTVSRYLREKGLKFTAIVEIQFYLKQLKSILGNQFTDNIRDNFISEAKKEFKQNDMMSLFKKPHTFHSLLYPHAQKFLTENLRLSDANIISEDKQNSGVKP